MAGTTDAIPRGTLSWASTLDVDGRLLRISMSPTSFFATGSRESSRAIIPTSMTHYYSTSIATASRGSLTDTSTILRKRCPRTHGRGTNLPSGWSLSVMAGPAASSTLAALVRAPRPWYVRRANAVLGANRGFGKPSILRRSPRVSIGGSEC
ncbi:hypothetical protein BV20DRAFT_429353 [Pilatotrama ljubarskyi]|nr:hypothetical protein BV20DRAFT_429353 [Pilatotrama ljubarskyi]